MAFNEKIRTFIVKLQGLPDFKKQIILWSVVIVLGGIMGFFWLKSSANKITEIGKAARSINLPKIEFPQSLQDGANTLKNIPTEIGNVIQNSQNLEDTTSQTSNE